MQDPRPTIDRLNKQPISLLCREHLRRMNQYPDPHRIFALQLLELALAQNLVGEDLEPEVKFLLRNEKVPKEIGVRLGLDQDIYDLDKNQTMEETLEQLLWILGIAVKEGGPPQNFL